MVEDVLPRTSQLAEPPVANVTHVLLVFSADQPPFQPAQVDAGQPPTASRTETGAAQRRLPGPHGAACPLHPLPDAQATRYLVSAEAAGLPVLVVLNKADLVTEERLGELVQEVRQPASRGEEGGLWSSTVGRLWCWCCGGLPSEPPGPRRG
jgi:ribosome biogenesis GTPase